MPPFKSFINKTQSRNAKHPYWQEIEIKSEEENERVAMITKIVLTSRNKTEKYFLPSELVIPRGKAI